jgi:uncharacterized membrane protein
LDLDSKTGAIRYANLIDHYRFLSEVLLFGLFAVGLVVFAGWTGAKALLSFVFSVVLVWKVLLPSFLRGVDPVLISLGVVTLLAAVILFLVGGAGRKGAAAFLGSLLGIAITCAISFAFGGNAIPGAGFRVNGAVRPFAETLLCTGFPHLKLTRLFFAGIFLASSGAMMDVAMDVAAAMQEVRVANPRLPRRQLVASGFAVGRAVIGTMTTTLLLAYSGGYTALLMVFMAQGTPILNVLNITYVSAEILHILAGSLGVVLVAPRHGTGRRNPVCPQRFGLAPRDAASQPFSTLRPLPGEGQGKRLLSHKATWTNPMSAGTSTSGPMTAANAAPEPIPNTATLTAIANSKLLLAAVNARVALLG